MFIPKLTPPESSRHCNDEHTHQNEKVICSNPFNNKTLNGTSIEDENLLNPSRLPTLTLLLGLRLVAYAGQAPTQDLADAFCFAATKRDPRRWGRQRIWSTIGWAIATFSVGMLLHELGTHYWLFLITAIFNIGAAVSIAFLEPLHGPTPMTGGSQSRASRASRPRSGTQSVQSRISYASSYSSRSRTRILQPQVTLSMLLRQTHVQVYLLFSMLSGSLLAIEFSFLLIFLKDEGGDERLIGLHQVCSHNCQMFYIIHGYIS